jgi:DNA polymerase-1
LETVEDPLAQAILDFRAEYKALSTYVRPMVGRSFETSIRAWKEPFIAPDGRVHANYRQLGARTGRMSCSDPNIQNQPRDDLRLRYNFRAEPGMKLVTCDLNSVEMAVFCAYAGEGRLMDAIRNGEDMHTMTADFIGLRERQRAGGVVESKRQRGKVFNFSVVYGAGVRSIRKAFRVSQAEARLMLRRYHDAYPEVGRLQARVEWRLQDTGYLKSALGRRYRMDPRDAYKGTNYLVQGTAAEIVKNACIKLHADGVPVVAVVHDEIMAYVPESDAEETRQTIIEALTDFPQIGEKVPLTADGDIVDRWSEAKDPTFKPRWDS